MNKIECIIFDWAGTTVDYGCFAPVAAFIKAFQDLGLNITPEEARGPMGMNKIDHIRELFRLEGVASQFRVLYGREWKEEDVVQMNGRFESYLFASLKEYTTPIDGVIATVKALRAAGLKIGSTTGYTRAMMDIVAPEAAAKGYAPDCCVTANHLPAGRPYPFMIYQNMINLAVASPLSVVKVGDTLADIREGVQAGVWSVGVILGSSEMGLTREEAAAMESLALADAMKKTRIKMLAAGADYVIDTLEELPQLIEIINNKIVKK